MKVSAAKVFYIAANTYEGCSHEHRSVTTATRCAELCNKRAPFAAKLKVCRCKWASGKRICTYVKKGKI